MVNGAGAGTGYRWGCDASAAARARDALRLPVSVGRAWSAELAAALSHGHRALGTGRVADVTIQVDNDLLTDFLPCGTACRIPANGHHAAGLYKLRQRNPIGWRRPQQIKSDITRCWMITRRGRQCSGWVRGEAGATDWFNARTARRIHKGFLAAWQLSERGASRFRKRPGAGRKNGRWHIPRRPPIKRAASPVDYRA
ncbi:MAG: hypothetical protein ACLTYN_16295 [Dysosmobacter welbionis]